ncbi:DUF1015 domain-containing protein [bacterium]|nr:MAG: DUF1015 domain-containing protein [bacterium]
MAKVIPFRGILYNHHKISNLRDVTTPPYDVISDQQQNDFYKQHPQNIIRLILGKTTENDTIENNSHTRAADFFNKWLSENVMEQDLSPAFYLTSVDFSVETKKVTRYGLIALVGVETYEKGIVLPHERTFSKVKSERLDLMKSTHANFSQIFALYPDTGDILNTLKTAVSAKDPDIDFADYKRERHKLWRITDIDIHSYVSKVMKEKKVFIADGHHRYETAINYRNWIAKNNLDFNNDHPANYVMMYLCSMQDPGLVILPAHRMLKEIQDSTLSTFIQKASEYFNVTTISFKEEGREKKQAEFLAILKDNKSKNIIGVYMKDRSEFYILTLRTGVMDRLFGNELSESLKNLDVTVLTRLVFMEILDFDQSRLDNEELIGYTSCEKDAIESVVTGKYDMSFILNPTKINQVRTIAQEGKTMPRKSTYFYPKVITGLVLNRLTL